MKYFASFIFYIFLVQISGCVRDTKETDFKQELFKEEIVLNKHENVLNDEFGIFFGGFADRYLLFEQDNTESGSDLYHVYDASSLAFLGSVGKRGRGPGEFYGALTGGQYYNSDGDIIVWVNDPPQFRLSAINISRSLREGQTIIESSIKHHPKFDFMNVLYVLDNGNLVGYQPGYHPAANENPLHILKGDVIEHFGEYPEVRNIENLKSKFNMTPRLAIVNRSTLVMRPDQKRFAVGMEYYDKLDIFNAEGEVVASIKHPENFSIYNADDLWDSQGKGTGAIYEYYDDLVGTQSYIFALMSGEKISNGNQNDVIRVFDWEGNSVVRLLTELNIGRPIMVDEKRGWLYARDMTNDGIVRFSIKDLFDAKD